MSFMDKAKDLAGQHPEQARQGLDKAEEVVDQRTGGQHTDQIHQAGDAAEKQLGINEQPPADQPPA